MFRVWRTGLSRLAEGMESVGSGGGTPVISAGALWLEVWTQHGETSTWPIGWMVAS